MKGREGEGWKREGMQREGRREEREERGEREGRGREGEEERGSRDDSGLTPKHRLAGKALPTPADVAVTVIKHPTVCSPTMLQQLRFSTYSLTDSSSLARMGGAKCVRLSNIFMHKSGVYPL